MTAITLHKAGMAQAKAIADAIAPQFLKTKVLPDGSVAALGDLMFTRAIYLGCTYDFHDRRFCFEDRARADAEFEKLTSEDDTPQGYTARRPER